jgi:hypothetical protein
LSYIKNVAGLKSDTQYLNVWMYHVPSKTLVIEHNFQMYINKELKKEHLKFLGKLLVAADDFSSIGKGPPHKLPSIPEECTKHCQQMKSVVDLDVRMILDYHCGSGTFIRRYDSQVEYHRDFLTVLSKTGEDNPDGSSLVQFMNRKGCMCC